MIKIFHSLPKDFQHKMIASAAERFQDTMTHSSLLLLLTSRFPEAMTHHGPKLAGTLMAAEKTYPNPLNPYRRKLVCELLPRLLITPGVEVQSKMLYQLLGRAIEFYVYYVISPKMADHSLESDSVIEDPWQDLFSTIRQIGSVLHWKLAQEFVCISDRELILKKIQAFVENGAHLGGTSKRDGDVREVTYTTLTIFLNALVDYSKQVNPDFTQEKSDRSKINLSSPLTLVEMFMNLDSDEGPLLSPTIKRPRLSFEEDPTLPILTVSRLRGMQVGGSSTMGGSCLSSPSPTKTTGSVSQAFLTALKSWDLLNSCESLKAEHSRIIHSLNLDKHLSSFQIDALMYKGYQKEAAVQLSQLAQSQAGNAGIPHISACLKLASVSYALSDFSTASKAALEVASCLPSALPGTQRLNLSVSATGARRHLHFLMVTRPQCLEYVTDILIGALRSHVLLNGYASDINMGYLITLLQYQWPHYLCTFEEVIALMQKQGRFTYHLFYNYIITPDIIEEFMYLATREPALNFDFVPVNQTSKQRTISTRGADRGSKHDFKVGMKKQMMRSDESIDDLIVNFLTREGPSILQTLSRGPL